MPSPTAPSSDLPPTDAVPLTGRLPGLVISAILAAAVCAKMLVTYDTFPGWSSDPTVSESAIGVSVTPAGLLAINIGIMASSALAIVLAWTTGLTRSWLDVLKSVLLAAGLAGIAWHIGTGPRATVEDWIGGSDLAAAFSAGYACSVLCRAHTLARVFAAILLASVVMLAARGFLQYVLEHDQTVATFRASREQILAANGWAEGSPMALSYERRLMQREATGWFGLSNVYGSIVGASAVGLAGLAIAARAWRRYLWLSAAAAAAALAMSGSKGATLATLIGAGLLAGLWWISKPADRGAAPDRLIPWLRGALANPSLTAIAALAMVIAAQGAILVRGLIGDRLGELSLWFRWFYVQGAARIFADHWGIGVGPAGFKDAYMIAKPAISPEDVASPHSLPWDLAATLGIPGIALGILWFAWICSLGRSLAAGVPSGPVADPAAAAQADPPLRTDLRVLALAIAAAGVLSVWVERTATTPESAGGKLIGLMLWIAVAVVIYRLPRGVIARGPWLAAPALVLAIHAQIEMTPVWNGSGAWMMSVIGLAAGVGTTAARTGASASPPITRLKRPLALAACMIAFIGMGFVLAPAARRLVQVRTWERLLIDSAQRCLVVTHLRDEIAEMDKRSDPPASREQHISDAIRESGLPLPAAGEPIDEYLQASAITAWKSSVRELEQAAQAIGPHVPTDRAASQLALRLAEASTDAADRAAFVAMAIKEADTAATAARQASSGLAWSATVRSRLAETGQMERGAALREAISALELAVRIDPFNFGHSAMLAKLSAMLPDPASARAHAVRALELEQQARLDPLRRMDDQTHALMEKLTKEPK